MALAPDFVAQLARLYLQYTPSDAVGVGQAASPLLDTVVRLLEPLTKVAPGQLEIVYLLAKAKYVPPPHPPTPPPPPTRTLPRQGPSSG